MVKKQMVVVKIQLFSYVVPAELPQHQKKPAAAFVK